jgi:hypothetical protein
VAASVASASRQTGSALGVAIAGSLVAGASGAGLASASHAVWALLAACGLAVAVVGYASTGRRALATADRFREILAADATGAAASERAHGPAANGDGSTRTGGDTRKGGDTGMDGDTRTAREARARGTALEGR